MEPPKPSKQQSQQKEQKPQTIIFDSKVEKNNASYIDSDTFLIAHDELQTQNLISANIYDLTNLKFEPKQYIKDFRDYILWILPPTR
ncbi:MAG: hypothetical protein LBC92_00090 [Rickettsiales bacterium]|jgi:hypothetical protein|nr:hypothetical protein [Rickettsiales bacterium]